MPLSTDPNATADFCLASDAGKPAESRPTFICRFMSYAEHNRIADLVQRAIAAKDDAECYQLVGQAIALGVIGWRNFTDRAGKPAPAFSIDAVGELLTPTEMWELLHGYPRTVRATEADLGNLPRQSPSAGAAPAGDAVPPASAPSPQTNP